ncbi:unnamed protein product, partial [Oppiella nova]
GSGGKKMTKSESKAQTLSTPSMANSLAANKTTPKDIAIVTQILKDMAITDYEPRVVNQMVEFTYSEYTVDEFVWQSCDQLVCLCLPSTASVGYVSNVLEDAHLFSSYAKKKAIDSDDISLSVQLQVDKGFTGPPPRDLLLEIARTKNNQTLPAIKSHNGPRLPADRYSLIACNYKQKSNKSKPQTFRTSMTGTSLLNNSSSVLKPMSTTPKTGSQILTIKSMDVSQGLKRKLDDS